MTAHEIILKAKEKKIFDQLQFPGDDAELTLERKLNFEIEHKSSSEYKLIRRDGTCKYAWVQYSFDSGNQGDKDDHRDMFGCYEKHYYPLLAHFTFWKLGGCLIKRISENREIFGRWMHPDAAGVQFIQTQHIKEVCTIARWQGVPLITLHSFELKRQGEIYQPNLSLERNIEQLRVALGQAAANSSWANYGYLVAPNLPSVPRSQKDIFNWQWHREANMLSLASGIGIVSLNSEDPNASFLMYPPKKKETIDLEMTEKLALWNSDFKFFLERVRKDLTRQGTKKEFFEELVNQNYYAPILEDEELYEFYSGNCSDTEFFDRFKGDDQY